MCDNINKTDALEIFKASNKCLSKQECLKTLKEAFETGYNQLDYFPVSNRFELYNKESDLFCEKPCRKTFNSLNKVLEELKNENITFQVRKVDRKSDIEEIAFLVG